MNKIDIGFRIKHIRESNRYNQEEFASILGVGAKHLSNIECGRCGISLELAELICDKFGISMDYLIRGIVSDQKHLKEGSSEYDSLLEQISTTNKPYVEKIIHLISVIEKSKL